MLCMNINSEGSNTLQCYPDNVVCRLLQRHNIVFSLLLLLTHRLISLLRISHFVNCLQKLIFPPYKRLFVANIAISIWRQNLRQICFDQFNFDLGKKRERENNITKLEQYLFMKIGFIINEDINILLRGVKVKNWTNPEVNKLAKLKNLGPINSIRKFLLVAHICERDLQTDLQITKLHLWKENLWSAFRECGAHVLAQKNSGNTNREAWKDRIG